MNGAVEKKHQETPQTVEFTGLLAAALRPFVAAFVAMVYPLAVGKRDTRVSTMVAIVAAFGFELVLQPMTPFNGVTSAH